MYPFDKPIKSLYFRSFVVSVLFALFHFKVIRKSPYYVFSCKTVFNSLHEVVPVLSYLLMKEDITPEEVNGHAIDVVFAGVDTVRKL